MAEPSLLLTAVIKRDGRCETYCSDKAYATLNKLSYGLDLEYVDLHKVLEHMERGMVEEVPTEDIHRLLALAAANLTIEHPDYALLAGRLEISELHRTTSKSFSKYVMQTSRADETMFSAALLRAVAAHAGQLDQAIRHSRDFDLPYFSVKTLQASYLLRLGGIIKERPQFLWMRTAATLHGPDLSSILETYDLLSRGYYTHATPTLTNAGRLGGQLSSCFIVPVDCRSPTATFDSLKDVATIFTAGGGIGVDLHGVPARRSDRPRPQPGVIPYMRLIDATKQYTTHGINSRPSAVTAYLGVYHADVLEFVKARSNRGQEELRTRNVFTALMVPDIFMRRVRDGGMWSLFDPEDVPELLDCYGELFEERYIRAEQMRAAVKVLPARTLWDRILEHQILTSGPFLLFVDAINRKSNQKHLGVIHSGNLCTEIVQYTSPDFTAVCTLSSIVLPMFVTHDDDFDFIELHRITKIVVRNTDRVLDCTRYPTEQARRSAESTRALGVGVQGLSDVFMMLHLPFDSQEAADLNRQIFETIYHASLEASCELAQAHGPHPSWPGSPASRQHLQFDMWDVQPSNRFDFDGLKARIALYGLRHSLLTAQMPTSSTSQIWGSNDGVEPLINNIYMRRTTGGEFLIMNKLLVRDLIMCGMWTEEIRQDILRAQGSVQRISALPAPFKAVYKTAWEIKQRRVIDMAASRGPFICQSQSTSIFLAAPTANELSKLHFRAWDKGLKTGMYYLRCQPAVFPDHFGLMPVHPAAQDVRLSSPVDDTSDDDEDPGSSAPHGPDPDGDSAPRELTYPGDTQAHPFPVEDCPYCVA